MRRRDREPSFAYPPLISQSFSRRLLRIALIVLALFDAIDEMLDLVSISGVEVIVVFHRRRSRRSYARQKRTPRPERKYFLFSRWFTAGTQMSRLFATEPAQPFVNRSNLQADYETEKNLRRLYRVSSRFPHVWAGSEAVSL